MFEVLKKSDIDLACIYYFALLEEIKDTNELLPIPQNVEIIRTLLFNSNESTPSFGIFDNGNLIGVSIYIYSPFVTKIKTCHCAGTYIHPEFRGMGLYQKFHEYIWDELRVLNYEKIYGAIKKTEKQESLIKKFELKTEEALCKVL